MGYDFKGKGAGYSFCYPPSQAARGYWELHSSDNRGIKAKYKTELPGFAYKANPGNYLLRKLSFKVTHNILIVGANYFIG